MSRPLFVDGGLRAVWSATLSERRPDVDVRRATDVAAELSAVDGPAALLTANRHWDDAYLDALDAGDWVATIGVGHENFPVDALAELGVAFTNAPGVSAEQIAEHVFGMTFAFTRRLLTYHEQQREREWTTRYGGMTDIAGDACCVVGLGGIGEAVAERARAFGMTVRGVKRTVAGYEGPADRVYPPGNLHAALDGARLVVVAVPLTDETAGMVGARELALAADDAILVNVARGPVVDADALLAALEDDVVRAAGLDVTDPEPLPAGSPLWDRSDVLVTPHCAGASDKYLDRFLDRFVPQYDRWVAGDPLEDRVV